MPEAELRHQKPLSNSNERQESELTHHEWALQ